MLVKVSEDFALNFPLPELSDAEFFRFCLDNKEYRIERSAEGRIEIMSNPGTKTGNRNAWLLIQIGAWSAKDGRGEPFDSSTLFKLPNSAMRSPDCAWVSIRQLERVRQDEPEGIQPICPEFVVELASPSDRLSSLKAKMHEWMSNGCELAWLIVPATREVFVYSAKGVETLKEPAIMNGTGPVEGLSVELSRVWNPRW